MKLGLEVLESRDVPSYTYTAFDYPGAVRTHASGINNSGQIVGWYYDGRDNHGFLKNGGNYTAIDVPGASDTHPAGINDAGQIVGTYQSGNSTFGFLLSEGNYTNIIAPGGNYPGGVYTNANGINSSGQIVGSNLSRGFLRNNSIFTPIDYPGFSQTYPRGINDAGQIVGSYFDGSASHGFLRIGGNYTTIDIPGAVGTHAYGINGAGQIVGSFGDGSVGHGFLRSGGSYTTIDIPGSVTTAIYGINDAGHIVGFFSDGGSIRGFLGTLGTSDIHMQSAQLVAGNTVQFTYSTTGDPGQFEVGLYRSTDGITYNPANRIGTRAVTPSPTNPQAPGTFNLPNPWVPDPSLPYLIVVADHLNDIDESDEDNNIAAVQLPTDIAAVKTTTEDSQSVIIEYDIFQADLTQPLEVQVFRSADRTYDAGTDLAASSVISLSPTALDLAGLPLGAVGRHRVKIPLPLSLSPRRPYVVTVLDPLNRIDELQEQNNESAFGKRILGIVTHGLVNPKWLVFGPTILPTWVPILTNFLKNVRGYDSAEYIDWASTSNSRQAGATENAGMEMASKINDQIQQMKQNFPDDLVDIHLIGHSRGTVVISEAMKRIQPTILDDIQRGYMQVTLLDPHPAYNEGGLGDVGNLAAGIAEVLDPFNFNGTSAIGHFSFYSLPANYIGLPRAIALEVLRSQFYMDDQQVVIPSYVDLSESFYQRTLARNVGGRFSYNSEKVLNLWGWTTPVAQPHDLTQVVPGISHTGVVDWYLDLLGVNAPVLRPAVASFAAGAGPGGGPHVRVYNADGSERFGFLAYDAGYTGGVNVATGDVTGDGVDDVVTGTLVGGAPHVKVFDGAIGVELSGFMAFDPAFVGGVSVAVGDVNGDGFADIAVGARAGGGPHVKVFSGLDGSELMSFFAYDMGFQGGVSVAVAGGDVVTGALAGGAPHVKVFAGMTGEVKRSFLAFDASHGGGVNVAGGDLNGDGVVDYLVGQASGGAMMLLDGATGGMQAMTPFDGFRGGVGVAVKDLDDDGTAEMLTSAAAVGGHLTPGRGRMGAIAPIPGAPRVRGLNLNGDGYFDFFAFDPAFQGGVSVG